MVRVNFNFRRMEAINLANDLLKLDKMYLSGMIGGEQAEMDAERFMEEGMERLRELDEHIFQAYLSRSTQILLAVTEAAR